MHCFIFNYWERINEQTNFRKELKILKKSWKAELKSKIGFKEIKQKKKSLQKAINFLQGNQSLIEL